MTHLNWLPSPLWRAPKNISNGLPSRWPRRLVIASVALALFATQATAAAVVDILGVESSGNDEILPPERAFIPRVTQANSRRIEVTWAIAPGLYLYRDSLKFTLANDTGISLGAPAFSPAERIMDPYFGETAIYRETAEVSLPLSRGASTADEAELVIRYQGCIEGRLCYPPSEQRLLVKLMGEP